ncbi:hypothetical protein IAC76_01595 [Spirochaetes bacterium]|uniref:Uncharacterized protein n=1 Tax=Candidatus Scatousia excrementipullorum TaxID=2840936 RepID=A0A9D9DLR8_9BACT|nr:hypothetical protein [Candidatus Scatousia excrementipullorum]
MKIKNFFIALFGILFCLVLLFIVVNEQRTVVVDKDKVFGDGFIANLETCKSYKEIKKLDNGVELKNIISGKKDGKCEIIINSSTRCLLQDSDIKKIIDASKGIADMSYKSPDGGVVITNPSDPMQVVAAELMNNKNVCSLILD